MRIQRMMASFVFLALLALLGACGPATDISDSESPAADISDSECDRACLVALMDQYLNALAKHDPSGLPLAENVKFTEDTAAIPIGDGLWVTTTGGPTDFKIYVADPVNGQVGFMGLIEENNNPAILTARLRLENSQITEVEHLVVRNVGERALPNLQTPRPGLIQPLDPSERVPREQMLEAANLYYEALEQDSGKVAPFADECQRRENGITTANNREPLPKPPPEGQPNLSVFGRMSCSDQLDTNIMSYITKLDERRLLVVDEEIGLVLGFSMFVHRGDLKERKIIGVPGIESMPYTSGAFNLPAAHIYKIRNGKIYEIEAVGIRLPYGSKSGW